MAMNIIISVNEKYIEPAKTMLFSLRAHTQDEITVWNLNHSVREEKVQELAEDIHSEIIGTLSRSDTVQEAEELAKTVIEAFPDSEMAEEYRVLARKLVEVTHA